MAKTTNAQTATISTVDTRNKFTQLEVELNEIALERKEVIRAGLLSLLTRTNMLQLGAPGAAKSYFTRKLKDVFGCRYFQYLFTKSTTQDELFGPISLSELRKDRLKRNTEGKAPWAHIYFADEVFKGSSAITNSNLTLINEHEFDAGDGMQSVPLISCFGASNELPEPGTGQEAIYDRFLQRFWVEYLTDAQNFADLLSGNTRTETSIKISLAELEAAQAEVMQIDISPETIKSIVKVRTELQKKNIEISDRRYKDSICLLKANAWLEGRTETDSDDLFVLNNTLWIIPEQIEEVRSAIRKMIDPNLDRAVKVFAELTEKFNSAKAMQKTEVINVIGEIKEYGIELTKLFEKSGGIVTAVSGQPPKLEKGSPKIASMIEAARQMRAELVEQASN